MSLDEIETKLKARLPQFAGLNALVKFDFADKGGLFVDARKTPPVLLREGADPVTTIRMGLDDFGRMIGGQLSPMWAFTTGKLKVQGNMALAMKLASLLED
ncbi:MAG TPA: SCP2 sterol-binding domain-containing protein [Azospirillaceae bacterium]|nr:SCP2 sterol-binding domain-containing protein [Azospirillaceae bacterium]